MCWMDSFTSFSFHKWTSGQDNLSIQVLKSLCLSEWEKPGMFVPFCTNSKGLSSLPVAACLKGSPELQEYWKLTNVLLLTTFCLFLELRKYQKLVEPPPSAKPITMDVDRKLEDGQKVTPVLWYRKEHLQGKVVASLNSVWGCCFPVFKQMKWVCWTFTIQQELLKVVVSVITQMGSSLSAACLNYLGVALFAEQCQKKLLH